MFFALASFLLLSQSPCAPLIKPVQEPSTHMDLVSTLLVDQLQKIETKRLRSFAARGLMPYFEEDAARCIFPLSFAAFPTAAHANRVDRFPKWRFPSSLPHEIKRSTKALKRGFKLAYVQEAFLDPSLLSLSKTFKVPLPSAPQSFAPCLESAFFFPSFFSLSSFKVSPFPLSSHIDSHICLRSNAKIGLYAPKVFPIKVPFFSPQSSTIHFVTCTFSLRSCAEKPFVAAAFFPKKEKGTPLTGRKVSLFRLQDSLVKGSQKRASSHFSLCACPSFGLSTKAFVKKPLPLFFCASVPKQLPLCPLPLPSVRLFFSATFLPQIERADPIQKMAPFVRPCLTFAKKRAALPLPSFSLRACFFEGKRPCFPKKIHSLSPWIDEREIDSSLYDFPSLLAKKAQDFSKKELTAAVLQENPREFYLSLSIFPPAFQSKPLSFAPWEGAPSLSFPQKALMCRKIALPIFSSSPLPSTSFALVTHQNDALYLSSFPRPAYTQGFPPSLLSCELPLIVIDKIPATYEWEDTFSLSACFSSRSLFSPKPASIFVERFLPPIPLHFPSMRFASKISPFFTPKADSQTESLFETHLSHFAKNAREQAVLFATVPSSELYLFFASTNSFLFNPALASAPPFEKRPFHPLFLPVHLLYQMFAYLRDARFDLNPPLDSFASPKISPYVESHVVSAPFPQMRVQEKDLVIPSSAVYIPSLSATLLQDHDQLQSVRAIPPFFSFPFHASKRNLLADAANRKGRFTEGTLATLPSLTQLQTFLLHNTFPTSLHYIKRPGEAGYFFAINLEPNPDVYFPSPEQNFIFLIDGSGTITKGRFQAFKEGVAKALRYLQPGDMFTVLIVDAKTSMLHTKPMQWNTKTVAKARKFLESKPYRGFFAADHTFSLIHLAEQHFCPSKHNVVILLTDGHSLGSIKNHRSDLLGLRQYSRNDFSLFTAAASTKNRLAMLDVIGTFNGGELMYCPTNIAFPRKLAVLVKRIKQSIAPRIHLEAIASDERIIRFYPAPSLTPTLYGNRTYTIYGTIDTLEDFDLLLQGRSRNYWVNIKQRISFRNAKKMRRLERTLAQQRAYMCYEGYLFSNSDPLFLSEAEKLLAPHAIPAAVR